MSQTGSMDNSLQGSWVELAYSRSGSRRGSSSGGLEHVPSSSSMHAGDLEEILLDAQRESEKTSSRSGSSRDSPPLLPSPQLSHCLMEMENRSTADSSSTQSEEDQRETHEEEEGLLRKNEQWLWDWASRPEHLPPKEFVFRHPKQSTALSIRKSSMMKRGGFFSSEILVVVLPSLLLTHLLTLGLGIYIGKRLATSSTSNI
ncbi:BCL2/adenovirus E1B 19 kDa protein-interacting protein 3-like [Latimeria chalumnae]